MFCAFKEVDNIIKSLIVTCFQKLTHIIKYSLIRMKDAQTFYFEHKHTLFIDLEHAYVHFITLMTGRIKFNIFCFLVDVVCRYCIIK